MPDTRQSNGPISSLTPSSPLQAYWQDGQAASFHSETLALQEVLNLSLVLLQASPASSAPLVLNGELSLSHEANRVCGHDPACLWLAPGQWLLLGTTEEASALAGFRAVVPDTYVLSSASSSRCAIDVCGDQAPVLLSRACGLNLSPHHLAVGSCAQTLFAGLDVLIYPHIDANAKQSTLTYRLLVARSDADYLWRWLLAAARDFC